MPCTATGAAEYERHVAAYEDERHVAEQLYKRHVAEHEYERHDGRVNMPDLVSSDESSDSDSSDESAAAAVPAVTPLPRAGHCVCSWGHAAAQGTA